MIPVDYVSECLLVAASVKVAGGDEVVGLGKGMFTKWKILYCLSLNPKFYNMARAAVALAQRKHCAFSAFDMCKPHKG